MGELPGRGAFFWRIVWPLKDRRVTVAYVVRFDAFTSESVLLNCSSCRNSGAASIGCMRVPAPRLEARVLCDGFEVDSVFFSLLMAPVDTVPSESNAKRIEASIADGTIATERCRVGRTYLWGQ